MKRPAIGTTLILAIALAASCVSVMYAGAAFLNLSFAPFVLVDWLARFAPGSLITFAIDRMVAGLQAVSVENLSATAKAAEMMSGVVIVFVLLTLAGSALAVFAPPRRPAAITAGICLGAILGASLAGIIGSLGGPRSAADAAWTMLVLIIWGGTAGWAASRLRQRTLVERTTRASDADRRRFLLRVGGASAVLTMASTVVGRAFNTHREPASPAQAAWSSTHALPNAHADVAPVPGTRPELTRVTDHYRIDINTIPPAVDGSTWRLRFGGLVKRPAALSLDEIRQRNALHQFITLSCISNPVAGSLIGTTRWSGVPLADLLDEVQPESSASHLRMRSADGFDEVVAIDLIRADRRVMLTYDWDGVPLPREHGYPLRVYIPDLFGMKQPKWIESIEAIDAWLPGYWVERGWDRDARMKATSVVDAISTGPEIGIGGIAHAGARGISRVEVSIDDGPWMPARLRQPISTTTWVLWRYDGPVQPGRHTVTVRCVDGDGQPQIVSVAPPHPSGATGLHRRTFAV